MNKLDVTVAVTACDVHGCSVFFRIANADQPVSVANPFRATLSPDDAEKLASALLSACAEARRRNHLGIA